MMLNPDAQPVSPTTAKPLHAGFRPRKLPHKVFGCSWPAQTNHISDEETFDLDRVLRDLPRHRTARHRTLQRSAGRIGRNKSVDASQRFKNEKNKIKNGEVHHYRNIPRRPLRRPSPSLMCRQDERDTADARVYIYLVQLCHGGLVHDRGSAELVLAPLWLRLRLLLLWLLLLLLL